MDKKDIIDKTSHLCADIGDNIFYFVLSRMDRAQHLTLTHIRLLKMLKTQGVLKMKDIAENLSIAPSGATYIVDGLIKENLVERDRMDNDRRVVCVKLTEEGSERLDEMKKAKRDFWKDFLEEMDDSELSRVCAGIEMFHSIVLKKRKDKLL